VRFRAGSLAARETRKRVRRRQRHSAGQSVTHASSNGADSEGAAGGERSRRATGRMSCADRGRSPCDVRAMQALQTGADRRRARQQGRESVGVAVEATERAGRWAVVGSSDGPKIEERRSRCRAGLVPRCNADWPDARDTGVISIVGMAAAAQCTGKLGTRCLLRDGRSITRKRGIGQISTTHSKGRLKSRARRVKRRYVRSKLRLSRQP
jgi:hypothetical protein